MRFVDDKEKDYGTTISGKEFYVPSATYISPLFTNFCNLFKNPLGSVAIKEIIKKTNITSEDLDDWHKSEFIDINNDKVEFTTYGLKYYKMNREFRNKVKSQIPEIIPDIPLPDDEDEDEEDDKNRNHRKSRRLE